MKAVPGDWLMIEGTHLNDRKRHGLILEIRGPDGSPPYLVRWDDGDAETVVVPSSGAHIIIAEEMGRPHEN
jgi:hypothetical protein